MISRMNHQHYTTSAPPVLPRDCRRLLLALKLTCSHTSGAMRRLAMINGFATSCSHDWDSFIILIFSGPTFELGSKAGPLRDTIDTSSTLAPRLGIPAFEFEAELDPLSHRRKRGSRPNWRGRLGAWLAELTKGDSG